MATLKVFGGNNILNMTMSKIYQQDPSRFAGTGSSGGFNFTFNLNSAPIVQLGSSGINPVHNAVIRMRNVSMNIVAQRGNIPGFQRGVDMRALGMLGITNGIFSFTSITVQIENPTGIDNVIVGAINSQIVPRLQRSLVGIALPQLTKIFGTDLSVDVRSGKVIAGPAFEMGARITGNTRGADADHPTTANLSSLNNGSATNTVIVGVVVEDAVNTLIKATISNFRKPFNEKKNGPAGTAGGIKGTLRATTPVLSITNGRGSAITTVSITGFKAGVKAPVIGWKWVSIPVPNVSLAVSHTISTSGNKAKITLTGVGVLRVGLNWHSLLRPVESLVQSLLTSVLNAFKSQIDSVVAGQSFELFKLPSSIPGTSHSASLTFERNGFSYFGNSVRAIVRVRS